MTQCKNLPNILHMITITNTNNQQQPTVYFAIPSNFLNNVNKLKGKLVYECGRHYHDNDFGIPEAEVLQLTQYTCTNSQFKFTGTF